MPTKMKPLPPQEHLKYLFSYDGYELRWRGVKKRMVKGRIAGCLHYSGARQVRFSGENYLAHRLIWKYVYGDAPEFIDHINGDPSDNRIENLRSVGRQENAKNTKRQERNISGTIGVIWDSPSQKWRSRITVNGKVIALGMHASLSQACVAREQANLKYGFHPNHGQR